MICSNAMGCSLISVTLLVITQLATLRHVTGTFPMLCGEDLVSAVAMVCQDRGYYVQPSKRSVASEMAGVFQAETRAKSFLKSVRVNENGRMKRRVRTGRIVTECCVNTCSVGIIESYCNPWPDESQHMESVHVRLGKSAEQDVTQEMSGRPQDGLRQVDNAQEEASSSDSATTRGRNRVEKVEEVLSERLASTSTATPSTGKKSRKDKSDRRKSSREAKAARREERRRNREKSSGGKSRGGRRKNKATDRIPRARRHSPLPWEDSFETENIFSFFDTMGTSTMDPNGSAPLTTKEVAAEAETLARKNQEPSLQTNGDTSEISTATNVRERRSSDSKFFKVLRTLVSSFTSRRKSMTCKPFAVKCFHFQEFASNGKCRTYPDIFRKLIVNYNQQVTNCPSQQVYKGLI